MIKASNIYKKNHQISKIRIIKSPWASEKTSIENHDHNSSLLATEGITDDHKYQLVLNNQNISQDKWFTTNNQEYLKIILIEDSKIVESNMSQYDIIKK